MLDYPAKICLNAVNREEETCESSPLESSYILRNPKVRFCVGHTGNLDVRVCSHNRNDKIGGKFTHKNSDETIIWTK
jgi:hypothetical protein